MTTPRALDPKLAAMLASIRQSVAGNEVVEPAPDFTPAPAPPAAPAAPPSAGPSPTLEAFVASIAEPHIKAWLDANLPELVQREVARAVNRLVNPEG